MNKIKCPKCGEIFQIDESGFANIVKQIRDQEFAKELQNREELLKRDKENAIKLAQANKENELREHFVKQRDEIIKLKSKIDQAETEKKLAVQEAVTKIEKERDALSSELKNKDTQKELELNQAVQAVEKKRVELENQLTLKEKEQQLLATSLKDKYVAEIKSKDEMIAYYKDMKARLSTKMIGETLELHCENTFNQIRSTAFPRAYFEKDNDARTGSKGDYIFRETDDSGNELISIMFEMKNEGDETATKKKNDDFLKELDKDRREKKCEYAVLVTLLEPDNEFYNCGIVDVSYRYPKMYIVRPQFFIPMITVLRNAALNSLQYKAELALAKSQNIDVTNFEENLNEFKNKFAKNVEAAGQKFQAAIDEIDKTIKSLEKIKENLRLSGDKLRLANKKADEVTIKKLTRGNPTMTAEFAKLKPHQSVLQ